MTQDPSAGRRLAQEADDMLEPVRALVQMATSIQFEFLNLWSQRAAAYIDLPRQVSVCKSASDLVEQQLTFLTTMQRNYADYAEAVLRTAKPAIEPAEREMAGHGEGRRPQPQRQRQAA